MRLKLFFGVNVAPVKIDWPKDVLDFPKVVNYNYRNWEWSMYQPVSYGLTTEYDLIFGELKIYDPRALEAHPTLIDILGKIDSKACDCGADKNPSSGGHWNFCKTRKK